MDQYTYAQNYQRMKVEENRKRRELWDDENTEGTVGVAPQRPGPEGGDAELGEEEQECRERLQHCNLGGV